MRQESDTENFIPVSSQSLKQEEEELHASKSTGPLCNRKRSILFLTIILAELFYGASYTMLLIFFPPLAYEIGLSESQIGLVIGATGLGGLLVSFAYQKLLCILPRSALWAISNIIVACVSILFAFIFHFEVLTNNTWLFFTVAFLAKFIMGFSRSGILTLNMSTVGILYPENMASKIALGANAVGIGAIVGPFIGNYFYNRVSYEFPFVVCAFLVIGNMLSTLHLYPNYEKKEAEQEADYTVQQIILDENEEAQPDELSEQGKVGQKAKKSHSLLNGKPAGISNEVPFLSNKEILFNRRNFTTYCFFLFALTLNRFATSGMSIFLVNSMNLLETEITWIFNVSGLITIGFGILGALLVKKFDQRLIIMVEGFFLTGLGFLALSNFYLNNGVWSQSLVQIVIGYGMCMFPTIQTAHVNTDVILNMEAIMGRPIDKMARDKISNQISTFFFASWMTGPILYSLTSLLSTFKMASGFFGVLLMGVGITYYFTSELVKTKTFLKRKTISSKI